MNTNNDNKANFNNYFYGNITNFNEIHGDYHHHGDYHAENNVTQEQPSNISRELLGQAIAAVQKYMWGKSAHAVLFCAMRDHHSYPDNMSLFERDWQKIANENHDLSWDCPEGTLRAAFRDNPYLKLPISKWEGQDIPKRVMFLIEKFEEQLIADSHN